MGGVMGFDAAARIPRKVGMRSPFPWFNARNPLFRNAGGSELTFATNPRGRPSGWPCHSRFRVPLLPSGPGGVRRSCLHGTRGPVAPELKSRRRVNVNATTRNPRHRGCVANKLGCRCCSSTSSNRFKFTCQDAGVSSPMKPPKPPSFFTTRWQGTSKGKGLQPRARPTARSEPLRFILCASHA